MPRATPTVWRDAARAWLGEGLRVRVRASGACMRPAICDGDVLLIERADRLRAGDVVVCRRGDGLIAHRVTATTRESVRLASDARVVQRDEWFAHGQVIGRVAAIERDGVERVLGRRRGWIARGVRGAMGWISDRARGEWTRALRSVRAG